MKKETEEWTENLLQLLYEWMRLLQKESEIAAQMELLMGQKRKKTTTERYLDIALTAMRKAASIVGIVFVNQQKRRKCRNGKIYSILYSGDRCHLLCRN